MGSPNAFLKRRNFWRPWGIHPDAIWPTGTSVELYPRCPSMRPKNPQNKQTNSHFTASWLCWVSFPNSLKCLLSFSCPSRESQDSVARALIGLGSGKSQATLALSFSGSKEQPHPSLIPTGLHFPAFWPLASPVLLYRTPVFAQMF